MRDLLYYYCGGGPEPVAELAVSLYTLLKSNPKRTFRIGIGLDERASALFDWRRLATERDIDVRILRLAAEEANDDDHAYHVVNRWRALELFDYDRALILDIDTVINRPLDPLFSLIHPDPAFFTTFAHFTERVRKWEKHRRFYDAIGVEYEKSPLYCAIGLHAVSAAWPHKRQVAEYCAAMNAFKKRNRIRRAFIEEYSINLTLLQNGRKAHFPTSAIRKCPHIAPPDRPPHVWHFILGRCRTNPLWNRTYDQVCRSRFPVSAGLPSNSTMS